MKSKICFVTIGNIYLTPYIHKYIENIKCEYDVIYWNRDDITEDVGATSLYGFNFKLTSQDSKFRKIKGYWYFRKYATEILKKNNYDRVIVLQTMVGVMLEKVLRKNYFKRFILDIRDYTLEKNRVFYYIEKNIINASGMTVISSEGYKEFLPPSEYVSIHNNRRINSKDVEQIRNGNKKSSKLVIAFIGYISYQEQHKKLLKIFKNDDRFELHFIGKEAENLIPFCEENNINNVKIEGKFEPENIIEKYKEVQIINNLYGNNTPVLDYALSNKLYFAATLGMPILVCEGTYMEKISLKYGFGYTFDFNDSEACDKLYEYYHNIDWNTFEKNCDLFLEKVNRENKEFQVKLKEFIGGEKDD